MEISISNKTCPRKDWNFFHVCSTEKRLVEAIQLESNDKYYLNVNSNNFVSCVTARFQPKNKYCTQSICHMIGSKGVTFCYGLFMFLGPFILGHLLAYPQLSCLIKQYEGIFFSTPYLVIVIFPLSYIQRRQLLKKCWQYVVMSQLKVLFLHPPTFILIAQFPELAI